MNSRSRKLIYAPTLLAALALSLQGQAVGHTFRLLHTFTALTNGTNNDGAFPHSGAIVSGGALYGVTREGGSAGKGTVFRMNLDGSGFTILHAFSAGTNTPDGWFLNSDGSGPTCRLVFDGNRLYGTTSGGGSSGTGTVFALNTNGTEFTTLYNFTSYDPGTPYNADGSGPWGGLVLSGNALYGTTRSGGASGNGTVFTLKTNGTEFTTLYAFTAFESYANPVNADGAKPWGDLALSGSMLYGTTTAGGSGQSGTVFSLNTDGSSFATLHDFARAWSQMSFTNGDGSVPRAGLVLSGNTLYGATESGGPYMRGTVFALNTDGSSFRILNSFASDPDVASPSSSLVVAGDTLYGAGSAGVNGNGGTLFSLTADGEGFAKLFKFATSCICAGGTNSDGFSPSGGLALSSNTLYGTAYSGGEFGKGTVFSLALEPAPPPQLHVSLSRSNLILSWPTNFSSYALQQATTLANGGDWQDSNLTPTEINGQIVISIEATNTAGFFRLRQP